MTILADQINAVTRRVARHGATSHTVALEQTFAAPAAELWDALTLADRLARWFEPVEGTLQEGGRYRLASSGTAGTIERCDAPHALRITWEYAGNVSAVEVDLTPAGVSTTLTLRHVVPADEHWSTYGPAATGTGWDSSLLALSLLLADDHRAHPDELEALLATTEGHDFIAITTAAWRAAHVAAGAEPELAREMAARTEAFYRGDA